MSRILLSIAWLFLAPILTLILWQLAVILVPLPHVVYGIMITLVVLAIVCSVPFMLFLNAKKVNHQAGIVLSFISLIWSLIVVLVLMNLLGVPNSHFVMLSIDC